MLKERRFVHSFRRIYIFAAFFSFVFIWANKSVCAMLKWGKQEYINQMYIYRFRHTQTFIICEIQFDCDFEHKERFVVCLIASASSTFIPYTVWMRKTVDLDSFIKLTHSIQANDTRIYRKLKRLRSHQPGAAAIKTINHLRKKVVSFVERPLFAVQKFYSCIFDVLFRFCGEGFAWGLWKASDNNKSVNLFGRSAHITSYYLLMFVCPLCA